MARKLTNLEVLKKAALERGYWFYYDTSLRMWVCYQDSDNAPEAGYISPSSIRSYSPELLIDRYMKQYKLPKEDQMQQDRFAGLEFPDVVEMKGYLMGTNFGGRLFKEEIIRGLSEHDTKIAYMRMSIAELGALLSQPVVDNVHALTEEAVIKRYKSLTA